MSWPHEQPNHDALEALKNENRVRLEKLAAMGVTLNGLSDSYMVRMLEYLCASGLPQVQMEQELFTATTLDAAEARAARARLLHGIGGQPK